MRTRPTYLTFSVVACIAAMAVPVAHAMAQAPGDGSTERLHRVVKVSANDVLNVRQGPSSAHAVVAQLPADSTGIRIEGACRGQWCRVKHGVGEGWVFKAYLGPQDAVADTPAVAAASPPPIVQNVALPPAKPARPAPPPETAFRFFVEKGWGDHHAAGIVGNLQAECGHALNCSVGSGGLAQWRGDRVSRFQKVFGYPFARAKFIDQLAYIHWELTHPASPWKESGAVLKRARDAGSAAALFDAHYERSSGATRGARIANARALLNKYGSRSAS